MSSGIGRWSSPAWGNKPAGRSACGSMKASEWSATTTALFRLVWTHPGSSSRHVAGTRALCGFQPVFVFASARPRDGALIRWSLASSQLNCYFFWPPRGLLREGRFARRCFRFPLLDALRCAGAGAARYGDIGGNRRGGWWGVSGITQAPCVGVSPPARTARRPRRFWLVGMKTRHGMSTRRRRTMAILRDKYFRKLYLLTLTTSPSIGPSQNALI